jgi:hypothetical protein
MASKMEEYNADWKAIQATGLLDIITKSETLGKLPKLYNLDWSIFIWNYVLSHDLLNYDGEVQLFDESDQFDMNVLFQLVKDDLCKSKHIVKIITALENINIETASSIPERPSSTPECEVLGSGSLDVVDWLSLAFSSDISIRQEAIQVIKDALHGGQQDDPAMFFGKLLDGFFSKELQEKFRVKFTRTRTCSGCGQVVNTTDEDYYYLPCVPLGGTIQTGFARFQTPSGVEGLSCGRSECVQTGKGEESYSLKKTLFPDQMIIQNSPKPDGSGYNQGLRDIYWTDESGKDNTYTLTGVVARTGQTIENGHYVSYVQVQHGVQVQDVKWFLCNDDNQPKHIDENELFKQSHTEAPHHLTLPPGWHPYLLFYQKDDIPLGENQPVGIPNGGNECYINALFQQLLNIPCLYQGLDITEDGKLAESKSK